MDGVELVIEGILLGSFRVFRSGSQSRLYIGESPDSEVA